MPEIRTDDGPRRLRALWLGPKGYTLPFEWTYVQWVVVFLTANIGTAMAGLVGVWFAVRVLELDRLSWSLALAGIFAVAWGFPAGVWLGVRAMRNVTVDEPLTVKVRDLWRTARRRHTEPISASTRWQISIPPIQQLASGSARKEKS